MRALIRDLNTGQFYTPDGLWAAERWRGCEFESIFQALTFAEDNQLDHVQVVLTFGEDGPDVMIDQDLERVSPGMDCLAFC